MEKLDRLMDILTCKFDIKSCTDVGCNSACFSGVHISCDYSREKKIPVIEFAFSKVKEKKLEALGRTS